MKTARQLDHEIAAFLHDGGCSACRHGQRRAQWLGSEVQSLLFARPTWTTRSARAWAKKKGYRSDSVDVTDNYVRLRQFDPTDDLQKRTITFGRGIKAIIEQEK
jgi:hypothetical protein